MAGHSTGLYEQRLRVSAWDPVGVRLDIGGAGTALRAAAGLCLAAESRGFQTLPGDSYLVVFGYDLFVLKMIYYYYPQRNYMEVSR